MPPTSYAPRSKAIFDPTPKRKLASGTAKITLPSRSNAGGAVRGQARAAQVKTMNTARKTAKGPGPTKATAKAADKRRGIVSRGGTRYFKSTGLPVGGGSAAKAGGSAAKAASYASRSAGFNPFGVPAGTVLDAIINSKRKR